MAIENAKTLNVRIKNKYDSYENWAASGLVLEAGEIAIAYTSVDVKVDNGTAKHPALLMKVGDGEKTFANLPWLSAKAADVLAACKDEEALKTFVNNVIADAGIASSDAMEALSGRVGTAEGKITTLEGKMTAAEGKITTAEGAIDALEELVGDTKVADQITAAINALNLADTYAAKTHGHAIADVEGLSDSIAAAKKAGTDANAALESYKTTNDAAVKVVSDAVAGIKNGDTIDNFKEVEEALAGKQAAGNYSVVGHKHEISDVNGLSDAIADAKKAGTDAAGAAAQALTDAKAYTDSEMTRLVGETPVSEQVSGAITALDLANTYAAKEHAHTKDEITDFAHTHTKSEITDFAHTHEMAEVNGLANALAGKETAGEAAKVQTALDEYKEANDAAVEAADGKAAAAQDAVDALAGKVGEVPADKTVVGMIADAQAAATYDDTDVKADIAALEGLVGDKKVSEAIAEAVKAEEDRAKGIEAGLEGRLAAVETDYLTSVEEKALQDQISANASAIELLTNGVSADEVDGVNDLIQYVKDHGTEVTGIKADIKTNADDIDALEGRMTAAEGAIATKAAQADLEALAGRVTTVEGDLNTETTGLKARMTAAEADIDALETKVGDKTVAAQIEAAIEALKIGDYAKAADLTAAITQHNTDKAALEEEIAKKANDADLAAIAKTGSTDDLVQGSMVLVFDCGSSAI